MSLKSRGVFKNFRNVFLLLFVAAVIFIPFEAARAIGVGDFISFNIFDSLVEFVATAMNDKDNKFFSVIFYLAYQLFNVCLLAVTILVYFGAWLVDVFLDEAIYARVLDMTDKTSAVYIGWTVIRDACNTFFILFLLLIAFSTILRVQTYNAKSLLPKFIISLFLINFSATIAMLVIDFGQVFMFEIKTWMGAGGFSGSGGSPTSAGSPLTSIVDHFNNNYNYKSPSGTYTLGDVVGVAFAAAYSAILGLLYIMLALFLAVRIVVFVILVIISPFAFFSIILPGMRTYTSQWWQSLVSHAIFGPVFIFFIFLSGQMMRSMQTFKPIKAGNDISSLHYIIAELIPHVVALMMLMAAIPVTQKLGAAGANKFIGGAAGLGKIGIGVVAGAKLAGGGAKKVGGGIDRRTGRRMSDWGRKKKEDILRKVPGGLGMGEVLKGQAKTERDREENMKKIRLEFGTEGNRNLDFLHEKAKKSSATTEDRAVFAEEVAAQGKMGDEKYAKDVKRFMPEIEKTLSGNDLDKLTDRSLVLATHTSEAKRRINNGDIESFDEKAQKRIKDKGETKEAYTEEIMKEKMHDVMEKGEAYKIQGLGGSAMATKVWHDGQTSETRKSSMNRMNEKQRSELAEGYTLNIKKTEGLESKELEEAEENNMEFSSNAVKLGKGLEESFAWGGDDAAEKIKKAFSDFNHSDVAKMSSKDLDNYGYNTTDDQIKGLKRSGENKALRRIYASMKKHDPERYKREESSATHSSPDKGSSGDGGGETEPGERWRKKMEEKVGGGETTSSSDEFETGNTDGSNNDVHDNTGGRSAGGPDGAEDLGSVVKSKEDLERVKNLARVNYKKKEESENYEYKDKETAYTLEKLAKDAGFEEEINVSKGNQKMGVSSYAISRVPYVEDGERKAANVFIDKKTDRISMGSNTLANAKDLFEADWEFSKGGIRDIMKHEKEHTKGPASENSKKEKKEMEEYSQKEGVSFEDIKKKKAELHKKYYYEGGGEMQTEVQRLARSEGGVEQYVEDTARAHVVGDALDKGMDKMGEIEYGPKNPGLHKSHSAFIKQDTINEITKRMETMRQDLVAKHKVRKDGGDGEPSDSGDDETSIEGTDEFMTGTGNDTRDKIESQNKKVEKIKKVAGAVNKVASNMNMKSVAGRRGKDPVAETKMAMKAIEIGSKLDKRVAAVKPVANVLLKKQLEIDERRQGGEEISQWQEDKEKLGALKKSVSKIIPKDSTNDGKYIEGVGKLLSELGEEKGGKAGAVMAGAGKVLRNKKAQEVISKEARKKVDKKEDEKPAKQTKSNEASKQWGVKETEQEKIIETKESVSKDGLKSSTVKSEITFDPVKGGEKRAEQIVKEAIGGMSSDMKQEITNNIAVDSQEAMDIDLGKIIDAEKIAELVKKGIDIKDVEKSFKDVKKSLKKFKENNGESANTTVFGAGISAAQTAFEKAQAEEDHKKQAIELATVSRVIGEINSGLKKQNKSDVGEEK